MLTPMDIPGAAAAGTAVVPWLVLAVVLGVALVVLAGLGTALVLRRGSTGSAPAAAEPLGPADDQADDVDDLGRFLEFPPGSGTAPEPTGWAALAPATAADRPAPVPRARRDAVIVLTAMSLTALLLLGIAAAVAATTGAGGRHGEHERHAQRVGSAATDRGAPDGVQARLTFGGLVLEPRTVGVTATYPTVEMSADGDRARARVEFPTFNCLSAAAPVDPVAAGCTPSVTEYAELRVPDLVVTTHRDGFHVTGRFATEVRPNGSAPVPTGRVYELRITVTPADGTGPDGWQPADGVLELGSERADTVDGPGLNVLRSTS
jgi:hypothetical protein